MRRAVVLWALALAGCLPSSQHQNDRSMSAADSASAAIAEAVPVDTLRPVWTASAPASDPMPVPSTLTWLAAELAVVETQDGSVRRFSEEGTYLDRTDLPAESIPYAAGARGDTLVVLARQSGRLLWVIPGEGVARSVPAPEGASAALAAPGLLAARVGGGPDTTAAAIVWLDESGAEVRRQPLAGPRWRSIGQLRADGDTVLALSGYRPVLDVVRRGMPADTLALIGFTSPQLVRSAQFMRGEVDEPPLLTSSTAVLGDRRFVLNLRTDHVRIDVYDRRGQLQRVLMTPVRPAPETVVAFDLAARPSPDGGVDLAVLFARPPGLLRTPESRITLYRWQP